MACAKGCCPDYKTHIRGIQVGSFPSQTTYRDKKLELDRDAYKDLRKQGLQPPSVKGAYVNARSARNETEVELGRPLPNGISETLFKEVT